MNTAVALKMEDSFLDFFEQAQRAIKIKSQKDYHFALELLDHLMERAEDVEGEPLLLMVDMVADAIDAYETSQAPVQQFLKEVEAMDPAVSTLRVLIDQYGLSYSDLKDEIGSKSYISQIMSGAKNLTRNHIAKLSNRFGVSPELFF